MHIFSTAIVCLLLGQPSAAGFVPADQVVVIRTVEMKTITGSTVVLTLGTTAVVREAEESRLKIAVGRVGWIEPSAVIAAAQAENRFSALIDKSPQDAALLLARGKARLDKAGLDPEKIDRAMVDFDQSLRIASSSEAFTYRGYGWKRKGDKDKAIADFDEAIKLNPKEALAWRIRGATWAAKAEYAKTLADYSESIRVDPENPDSRHHRVILRSACMDAQFRDGKQAIEDATKACEVSEWKNPLYLMGLAFANAESGDFDAAIKWQTKALELSAAPSDLMRANLELFRQQKPFRMTWK